MSIKIAGKTSEDRKTNFKNVKEKGKLKEKLWIITEEKLHKWSSKGVGRNKSKYIVNLGINILLKRKCLDSFKKEFIYVCYSDSKLRNKSTKILTIKWKHYQG